jgi:Carboxypeptidase regulatory-like domain/TonB dependent receptor
MGRAFAIVYLAAMLLPSLAWAQSDTATISGRITEQTGAVLDGAQVRGINLETGKNVSTYTNNNGVYVLRNLYPGPYRLVVDKVGFRQIILAGLVVHIQDAISRNFTMQVGSVIQSISLIAGGEQQINISPAVSTVVNEQFIQNMPLNGRSFQSLIGLTPGLVFTFAGGIGGYAPGQFSVNGQRTDTNYFMLDGVSSNYSSSAIFDLGQTIGGAIPALTISGGTNGLLSVDAMQEFRIQTSSFAPEFGRSPGAQISLLTKSGTNQFHGTAFDYFRNDALDARNYFNAPPQPKPPLRQNDFGGTFGGPIFHNRTFFFLSYEGLRLQLPKTASSNFYTLAARANVASVFKPLLAALPVPDGPVNADGLTAPISVAYSDPTQIDAYSLRLDHTFTQRATLFLRLNHAPSTQTMRDWSVVRTQTTDTDSLTVGTVITFGINKANDLRANWGRQHGSNSSTMDDFHGAVPPPDSAMFPPGFSSQREQFVFIVGSSFVSSGLQEGNVQRQINVVETFSMTAGKHQLKFGFDFRRLSPTSGATDYNLGVDVGTYALLQEGLADSVSTFGNSTITAKIENYSFFAQDTWRASPRLTLTYGLRWDMNTPPVSTTAGKPLYAVRGIFDSEPFGLAPADTPLWRTRSTNFAPRIGGSYQLTPGSLVRGGFGLFYDLGYGGGVAGTLTNFPYSRHQFGFTPVPFDFSNPAFQPPPFTLVPSPDSVYMNAVNPNLRSPIIYQWNASFERGLGANQSFSVSYVGASGRRLLRQNIVRKFDGNLNVFSTLNAGWSNYNSLQMQFQRRMSRGLQALVSYTLARSMDTDSTDDCGCNSVVRLGELNPAADYGPSDFDVRHSFSAAVSYELPRVDWVRRSGRTVVHGLSVDGIVRASSSPPFDVRIIAQSPVFGSYRTRPNIVPGVPFYLSDPGVPDGRRLNPAAFSAPSDGQAGNLPRNYFRTFPIFQTDVAFSRRIALTESLTLTLRAELFNLFNHPMFSIYPNDRVGSRAFGIATRTLNEQLGGLGGLSPLYQIGGARSIQLTIKLQF